jgi:hypothetical protein
MASQEEIEYQKQRLANYRRTLAQLLQYRSLLNAPSELPGLDKAIVEARANIASTKVILGEWGIIVEDYLYDVSEDSAVNIEAVSVRFNNRSTLKVALYIVIPILIIATITSLYIGRRAGAGSIPTPVSISTPAIIISTSTSINRPTSGPKQRTPTAISNPTITPAANQPTSTPTFRELADQEFKRLDIGTSAFNPPAKMEVGESAVIRYRLGFGTGIITPTLVAGMPAENRSVITNDQVKISSRMIATLVGEKDAFDIIPTGENGERLVLADVINEWSWNVTAKQSGPHKLTFQLVALIDVGDKSYRFPFPVDEKEVTVNVNWMRTAQSIISENWRGFLGWLLPSSVVATVFAWWQRRRLRRQSTANQESTEQAQQALSSKQSLQERAVAESPSQTQPAEEQKRVTEGKKKNKRQ